MSVLRQRDLRPGVVEHLLSRFGICVRLVPTGMAIPGSFWGDEEAGLTGNRLFVREDTPVHSILHEACHYICMTPDRRRLLATDAGGDYDEENGVCYLQVLLAEHLDGVGRDRMIRDMDAWGYSFRLGSAGAWFARDADDARDWLTEHGLIDAAGRLQWRVRGQHDGQSRPEGATAA